MIYIHNLLSGYVIVGIENLTWILYIVEATARSVQCTHVTGPLATASIKSQLPYHQQRARYRP